DELAGDWDFEAADEVSHEDEAVLEQSQSVNRLTFVFIGDLSSHLLYTLLNLFRWNHRPQRLDSANLAHGAPCIFCTGDFEVYTSSIRTASLASSRGRSFAGEGKPRIHTMSAPLVATGHNFLSSPVMRRS